VRVDLTIGIDTTGTGAGVNAPGVNASQVTVAVSVHKAFWFAPFCCVTLTKETWKASTDGIIVVSNRALSIRTTRGWLTGIVRLSLTLHPGVAIIALSASTFQIITSYIALSILTTNSKTACWRRSCWQENNSII